MKFSKFCYICDNHAQLHGNNVSAPLHCCDKNWTESSKAMHPHGIVKCTKGIVFISDNDSISHAAFHHSIPDKIWNGSLTQYPIGKDSQRAQVNCLQIFMS